MEETSSGRNLTEAMGTVQRLEVHTAEGHSIFQKTLNGEQRAVSIPQIDVG